MVRTSTYDLYLLKIPPIVKPERRVRRNHDSWPFWVFSQNGQGTMNNMSRSRSCYTPALLFLLRLTPFLALRLLSRSGTNQPMRMKSGQMNRSNQRWARLVSTRSRLYITQPLKRLATEVASTGDTSYSLTNLGTEPAYPKLVVTGAGEQTVTVGTQTLTIAFDAGGETITIDSLNGQIYDAAARTHGEQSHRRLAGYSGIVKRDHGFDYW